MLPLSSNLLEEIIEHATGLLRITTATATPNPATIYLGEPTVVTITVTHPATGTPLEDVRVGLDHGMLLNESILAKLPTDLFTDANGQVEFSLTADASGEVTIYIENETDPDNEFVIYAAARKPMTISVNPSVDEGKTFTVEAKSYGVTYHRYPSDIHLRRTNLADHNWCRNTYCPISANLIDLPNHSNR